MFKAMGPRGTLGPGPLGANWARAPGEPLGPGSKGTLGSPRRRRRQRRQFTRNKETSGVTSGFPSPPDPSRAAFYFFLIGEWEIVIVNKTKYKMESPPPAHPILKSASTPTRRSTDGALSERYFTTARAILPYDELEKEPNRVYF